LICPTTTTKKEREHKMCKQKLEFAADSKKKHAGYFFINIKKGWWRGNPIFFKKKGKKLSTCWRSFKKIRKWGWEAKHTCSVLSSEPEGTDMKPSEPERYGHENMPVRCIPCLPHTSSADPGKTDKV
jgi:hypothetical protein